MSGPSIVRVLEPEVLIEEVRRHPVVYEDRHRKGRDVVEEAWVDISRQLEFDVQTCKLKWHDLRNTYLGRRKLKLGNHFLSQNYLQYFELMGFLDSEATREKDNDDMLEAKNKAEYVDSTGRPDTEMTDADSLKTTVPTIHLPPGVLGLFLKSRNQGDAMEAASSESVDLRVGDLDSDLHFLLSLLPLMKQLSPQDNLDIRIQIQSAFKGILFPDNSRT